jgi:formylglycine-generating enzyme required for sulfatase activity
MKRTVSLLFVIAGIVISTSSWAQTAESEDADVITNSIGMKLKLIQPGTFKMGSPKNESDRSGMEKPVREITISKPFYIGVYEVTQEEWTEIMGNNPSGTVGKKKPVDIVSWNDAQEFLAKLSKMEGVEYRLPTGAEWEYAARAGTDTAYYWGDTWDDDYGWCSENSGKASHDVGMKKPNAWGLYDMSGNVWEWCQDWFEDSRPNFSAWPRINRVVRGGSWNRGPSSSVSASNDGDTPGYKFNTCGFRVVRTP